MPRSRRAPARPARPARGRESNATWTHALPLALFALHAALLLWVSARQSVTFDESFHLPAGVRIVARHDFLTSFAQPPLAKSLAGAVALLAGAKVPADSSAGPGGERFAGYAFMRDNARQFQQLYGLARIPSLLESIALAWLVWRLARRWFGNAAGVFALAAYVLSPESLAHGSLVGVDLPTGLTFFGAMLAFARFARGGRWSQGAIAAAWFAAAFLVRFSAVQLFPAAILLLVALGVDGGVRRPARAWVGLAALGVVAWGAVEIGYLGIGSFQALGRLELHSSTFMRLQHVFPRLPVPFPEAYVRGLDYLAYLSQPGSKISYFMGRAESAHHLLYFPVAILIKYPLGWLGFLLVRCLRIGPWRSRRQRRRAYTLLLPVLVVLGVAMTSDLDYGLRYVFPILPFLAVWCSSLVATPRVRATGRIPALAWALLAAVAIEVGFALPYPLSFFNAFAGGPGKGDRIVNDSNVDWGQGLVALHDELARRGIGRIHLAYHGTVDPALYGIDYVPYTGGAPGHESDWIAVSSYFYVGLPARMTTSLGQSQEAIKLDFRPLWPRTPVARPAGCMYLFRLR
jgi:hypothetical protein